MASPLGNLAGFLKFPGERVGNKEFFQFGQGRGIGDEALVAPQVDRFFGEIDRLQGLDVEELTRRNLRAALPQVDLGFSEGLSRLNENVSARGLGFSGIRSGSGAALANLLGGARSQAALSSLFAAEEERRQNIEQAIGLFSALFNLRFGQAQTDLGFDALRSQSRKDTLDKISQLRGNEGSSSGIGGIIGALGSILG